GNGSEQTIERRPLPPDDEPAIRKTSVALQPRLYRQGQPSRPADQTNRVARAAIAVMVDRRRANFDYFGLSRHHFEATQEIKSTVTSCENNSLPTSFIYSYY